MKVIDEGVIPSRIPFWLLGEWYCYTCNTVVTFDPEDNPDTRKLGGNCYVVIRCPVCGNDERPGYRNHAQTFYPYRVGLWGRFRRWCRRFNEMASEHAEAR